MASSIENLPIELWFMIFLYLDGNDIKNAFSNLNTFVTRLLHSFDLRIHINVNIGGCKIFEHNRTSFHSGVFETLHANLLGSTDLLNFMNTVKTFPNLRSLSLAIRRQKNYDLLILILPQLSNLEHLMLSCPMLHAHSTAVPLISEILKLSKLRICKLRLSRNPFNIRTVKSTLPISMSLRYFHIDATMPYDFICDFIQFMPLLHNLSFYTYRHEYENWDILKSYLITKTECRSFIGSHIHLPNLFRSAPKLEHFRIQIEPYGNHSAFPDFSHKNNIHVQIICKKNITSNILDIVSPIVIQARKDSNNDKLFDDNKREYIILKEFPIIDS